MPTQAFRPPVSCMGANRIGRSIRGLLATALICGATVAEASLESYDALIRDDAAGGLPPVARLTSAVTLTGANRAAFDYGTNSGDATMEFILEGNPAAGTGSAYLAVGTNSSSNLRYKQWNNTGQLGFTQLGVLDYLFLPAVSSPTQSTHITFVWNAATRTMKLYVNGALAGTRSGVDPSFAMPTGQGWLGANPGGTEAMVGTLHRVTVYDDIVSEEVIQGHADAYNDVVRPPIIVFFVANPTTLFTPGSATLSWDVRNALAVFINGADVTAASSLTVSPGVTTTYTLIASNLGASATGQVTVVVNPAPVIHQFTASRSHVATGETITLSWVVSYGESFSISPGVGEVTAQTSGGVGSIQVQPTASLAYTLVARSEFGTNTAEIEIHLVQPAPHPVISEFMADDESTLADEDGEHSGWIEIHNPTASPVNLAGHYLTDDAADPTRWAFPAIDLAAGGYLVVFASGKDRANLAAPLHANFRLNNAGEYLALVGPGPALLHALAPRFPPQRADISYGILGGDPGVARYFGVPTPGAPNNETLPPPAPVEFSVPSGLFTEPFSVVLSVFDPGAEIRFTVNGSIPGPTNGAIYTAPIPVTNTTRLRAVAMADGRVSRLSGASYIKLAPELAGYTSPLPIMVIENFGAGLIRQKGWNSSGAGIQQVPRQPAAWITFERDGGLSAFTNVPQMFSLIGIRGRGAYSTEWRQKPYSVEAMDEDGAEAEVSPLGLPAHADWVLYFPDPDQNKDPALLFNTFAYELSRNMGHYAVRFRWVEAFINEDGGELKLADRRGVYAIIEKVSRGRDRLDFQRLSADGSTGGWLLNINRMDPEPETGWPASNGAIQPWFFHTAGANRLVETAPNTSYNPVPGDDQPRQWNACINFDNPNGYVINTNQRVAIENWFRQFEDVLYSNALWRDPVHGYRRYLDPLDFADYFVLNVLTRNGDGLLISMFPWKGDDGRLRMGPAWDYNWNPYYVSGGPTGSLLHRSDRLWYARLFTDPDFLQLYIDRWWDLRRGPMSNAAMDAIIDGQAADITPEKALLNGLPSVAEWTNRLGLMKTWLTQRADWIDSNYLRPPVFNQEGGLVPDGFQVALTGGNGTIYFTLDGSDPRAPGGAVAAAAQAYQGPFALESSTFVQARLRNGTNWSGLTAAFFSTPQDLTTLALTEIMYHPPDAGGWNGDDLEFLELKNTGAVVLDLGGLVFTAGIGFTFTNGTRLGPGQFFVLTRNAAAFSSQHPAVPWNGLYTGRLDNAGETLRLATPSGSTVFEVTYNDRAPWPLAADGHGFSAVPGDTTAPGNSDLGAQWRASSQPGGSPGADDPEPTVPPVVINEILTHTAPPELDAIELFNPTAQDVDLGGWFLSDDGAVPTKFRIPDGTVIPAGGYRVFTETDFNPEPGTLLNFSLDSAGDAVYLVSADGTGNLTGYSHGLSFGAAALGVSFGRYVNSVGEEHFPPQLASTPGTANAGPIVGPVVISEILYHPDADSIEFVELRNLTPNETPLFDPANPTNTWRVNGLGFSLPTNVVLLPNGLALVVATNPVAFRTRYAVPESVPVFGPFGGGLQDNGERLELQRPGWLDTNGFTDVTVDEVRYDDQAPWPPAADGGGASLQRRMPSAYGNDPVNWEAALPTPGLDFVPGEPPVILVQPQDQEVAAGQTATFSVEANGSPPLQFHWLFHGSPLFGATNALLRLPNVQAAEAGEYQVAVFNEYGSVSSGKARLDVRMPPLILQPPTNVAVRIRPDPAAAPSTNATFSVLAFSIHPMRYQWRFNGEDLPGATNSTLVITNVQLADEGDYTVAVTDRIGPAVSVPARLSALITPVITVAPLSQTVVERGDFTVSVALTGNPPPFLYHWRRGSTPLVNLVLSERRCFLTISNVQADQGGTYRVAITNAASANLTAVTTSFNVTVLADVDGDGLPDTWEAQHFGSTTGADPGVDADGDGMTNGEEFDAGTDPTNAASHLKIETSFTGDGVSLSFGAVSNETYTLQYSEAPAGPWLKLIDIVAHATNRIEVVTDSGLRTNRFYRVATPRQP